MMVDLFYNRNDNQYLRSFMPNNILTLVLEIVKNQHIDVQHTQTLPENRIQAVGSHLENYVKEAFVNTLNADADMLEKTRMQIYSRVFSWLGNANNPPDMMLKGGDAIEIKKIASPNSAIALNSSHPKQRLKVDDPMITHACRESENWDEKDLLYIIGVVPKNTQKLISLWLVYGDCYCASETVYERVAKGIRDGIHATGLELSQTKELGRVNRVDPLGITNLRVRGMWHIDNPARVFANLLPVTDVPPEFTLTAIMRREKYQAFPPEDRNLLEQSGFDNLTVSNVTLPSPDNPAKLLDSILIRYAR